MMSTLQILAGGGRSGSNPDGKTTEFVGGNDVGLEFASFVVSLSFIEFVAGVTRSMGFDGRSYFLIRHVPSFEGGIM